MKKIVFIFLGFLFFCKVFLFADTYVVGSCGVSGDHTYTKIKDAIDAATNDWNGLPHSIKICPATYNENNIRLDSSALNNAVIESTTNNANDVTIVNSSNQDIFKITAYISNITIQDLSFEQNRNGKDAIVISSGGSGHAYRNLTINSNGDGIHQNNSDFANATLNNLNIRSKDDSIRIKSPNNVTIKDVNLTSTNSETLRFDNANGRVTITTESFDVNTLESKNEGIIFDAGNQNYTVENTKISITSNKTALKIDAGGEVWIKNVSISTTNDAILINGGAIDKLNIEDLNVTQSKRALYINKDINNRLSISNIDVVSSDIGLHFAQNVFGSFTIDNAKIRSQKEGIYFANNKDTTPVITNSDIVSVNEEGIYTENKNYTSFTLKNSCVKTEKNNKYALNININGNSSVAKDNCFYASSSPYLARARVSGNNISSNFWSGHSGNYNQNNINDTTPRSSCPNSCGGEAILPIPIADYRFDECEWKGDANEVKDESLNSYHGVAKKGASTDSLDGIINNYGKFDGTQYVELSTLPNLMGSFTITAWFNSSNVSKSGQRVFADDGTNSNGYAISLGDGGSGRLRFYDRTQSGAGIIDTNSIINENTWYFVAAVVDIDNAKRHLYVYDKDGSLLSSRTLNMTNTNVTSRDNGFASIGGEPDGGEITNRFLGHIDEVHIFDNALSQEQIENINDNEKNKINYDGTSRNQIKCGCNFYSGILDPLEFEGKTFRLENTYDKPYFTKIKFDNRFSSPPAVFILPTKDGGNVANIRIKNITTRGFEAVMAEPVGEDGPHIAMNVNYFAINPGVHKIGNTILEVGNLNTKKVKPITGVNQNEDYGWEQLSTKATFCDPTIVATVQSSNNEPNYDVEKASKPFLVPAVVIDGSDINLTLDKVPTSGNSEVNVTETISYMIAEANIQDVFVDSKGDTISFETIRTEPFFQGWNDGDFTQNFVNTYTKTPLIAATKVSNNEEEPAWFRSRSISNSNIRLTLDESRHWPSKNERSHAPEKGSIFVFSGEFYIFTGICQYMKAQYDTTQDGYYYVDEGTASRFGFKPFEVYCANMNSDGAEAYLPTIINKYNTENSNFKFDSVNDDNYYHSSNTKTYFDKIKVDNYFFAQSEFLDSGFSNINLIGTSFKIDMENNNTVLATCDGASDTSKLRIGHYNQAIKIDPKVDDEDYCTATQIKFTQIPNYYAKDEYKEKTSCAQIAQTSAVPLPSGYYLLKREKRTAEESKYIVAYCNMNPPENNQIWTMFVALDGNTTDHKDDVVDGRDTCSQVGYSFYMPNNKETMEASRSFLYNIKSEWQDYTGTVREYFDDHDINGWATDGQASDLKPNPIPDGAMWPYGPFGIYRGSDGSGGSSNKKMPMSTQFLSEVDKNDSFGSLDELGWKSALPEVDSTYEDTWWIADIAAGYKRNETSGRLELRTNPAIEPNGDYNANNWLGWFADENGYIVHYNDQSGSNKYKYSNYICMSKNMYEPVVLSWESAVFDAWDTFRSVASRFISTKIVGDPFQLTVGTTNDANSSSLGKDFNGTVCVEVVDTATGTVLNPGGVGTAVVFNAEKQKSTAAITVAQATKNATVKLAWVQGVTDNCPLDVEDNSTTAFDDFAIRPKSFNISTIGTLMAGRDIDITFQAHDQSNNPTPNYNESEGSSFSVDYNESITTCRTGEFTPQINSGWSFTNGQNSITTRYDDIGVVNVQISEVSGSEFASVDNKDPAGSPINVEIPSLIQTLTFNPHDFNVSASLSNVEDEEFTYLAANYEEDMSASLDINISAIGEDDRLVQNYEDGCYANTVNLSMTHSAAGNNLNRLWYILERQGGVELTKTEDTLPSPWNINSIDTSAFDDGEARLHVEFNFDRTHTRAINPFEFDVTNVEVQDTGYGITKNVNPENNATFYYGRVKTFDVTTTTNNIISPVEMEVYDSSGSKFVDGFFQNSIGWYRNALHDEDDSGEVLTAADSLVDGNYDGVQDDVTIAFGTIGNGTQDLTLTTTQNPPLHRMMHLDIPEWLWYTNATTADAYDITNGSTCKEHPCFEYLYEAVFEGDRNLTSGDFNGSDFGMSGFRNNSGQDRKRGTKVFR